MKIFKTFIALALCAGAMTACNNSGNLNLADSEDFDQEFAFQGDNIKAQGGAIRTQGEGDIPTLRVRLSVKTSTSAAGFKQKSARATFKWGDNLTTATGNVTLSTRRLNSATVLGANTTTITSSTVADAAPLYVGNIAPASPQLIDADALCVDVTWSIGARASGAPSDAYVFNQSTPVTYCQKQAPAPIADLAIAGGPTQTTPANANKTVELAVVNNGPKAASNVSVVTALPLGVTWVAPTTPPAGALFTCSSVPATSPATGSVLTCIAPELTKRSTSLKYTLKGTTEGSYSLPVTISSPTLDPISGNNESTQSFIVSAAAVATVEADLASAIAIPTGAALTVGTPLTYTVSIGNLGPDASSSGRQVKLYRSSSLDFISATGSAGITCVNALAVTTCTLPAIANSGTGSITLSVNPSAAGVVAVTAQLVAAPGEDTGSSNNTSNLSSTIQ